MDPTTADLLADLTASFDDVARGRLIGVYPFGSVAWGDYVLGTSDVDVMAVIDGSIASPAGLRHARRRSPGPTRPSPAWRSSW